MTQQGPQNLADLGAPQLVHAAPGISAASATGPDGGLFIEVMAVQGQATVDSLIEILKNVPGDMHVRDVFSYTAPEGPSVCINFWKEAAKGAAKEAA
ncbi:hypothetical protein [Nonomuraea jabiensis]|uniref:hypothetical protein n=1 Tax=Nonomuraea jabiensis TaxID=882448 RepID=UPI003D7096E6